MALITQLIESFVRIKNQAWHSIPLWEDPTGRAWNAQADLAGALIVTVGGADPVVQVEGAVADGDPVGATNPVVMGGVYLQDPTADLLADGDAGYVLLNNQRMQIVEASTYDPVSDADKNIPVWSPPDLWAPSDLSATATANGTTTRYVVMAPNTRWSIQWAPTPAAGETITLTVAQTDENEADVTANDYKDITTEFFGVPGFTTDAWVEPSDPTACTVLRIQVTVTGYTAGTSAWSLFVHKRSNS